MRLQLHTANLAMPNRVHDCVYAPFSGLCNYVRVIATSAPAGSNLEKKIKESGSLAGVLVYEGPGGAGIPFPIDLRGKGGKFNFKVYEIRRGASAHGGSYKGDPLAAPTEQALEVFDVSLTTATRLTVQIGTSREVTLVIWADENEVRRTYDHVHGENSPRLEPTNVLDVRARRAIATEAVQRALEGLIGLDAETLCGDPAMLFVQLLIAHNTHVSSSTAHGSTADTSNVLLLPATTPAPAALGGEINKLLEAMRKHRANVHGSGALLGTVGTWHAGGPALGTSSPLYSTISARSDQLAALADIARAHDAHVQLTTGSLGTVHSTTTPLAPALPPLVEFYRTVLTELNRFDTGLSALGAVDSLSTFMRVEDV